MTIGPTTRRQALRRYALPSWGWTSTAALIGLVFNAQSRTYGKTSGFWRTCDWIAWAPAAIWLIPTIATTALILSPLYRRADTSDGHSRPPTEL